MDSYYRRENEKMEMFQGEHSNRCRAKGDVEWRMGEENGWGFMLLESEGCHGDWSRTRRRPVSIDTLFASAPLRCDMDE